MDDKNYSRSRSKKSHSDNRKHERNKNYSRGEHPDSVRQSTNGAKTPPLPVKFNTSMEDLIRKRESIQKELNKIEKLSNTRKLEAKPTVSRDIKSKTETSRKRHHSQRKNSYSDKRNEPQKNNDIIKITSHSSNENLSMTSDDDEDNIIEQRRKLRKQLLEKLNTDKPSTESESNSSNPINVSLSSKENIHKLSKKIENKTENTPSSKKVSDMFSEHDDFHLNNLDPCEIEDEKKNNVGLNDNWDDAEGYYKVRVGEYLDTRKYIVKAIVGQGVFANVIRAEDVTRGNREVAIKISRRNDLMYKTGIKEISLLRQINEADPENKYHCIRYINKFLHKGHLCLVMEPLHMDLRAVLKKYGKKCGINIGALVTYTRQLLLALKLLKKLHIIHADIKPDNILVNEKKNILKLCDFGSASKVDENELTPYLVSRFYRAPEIILGISYGHGVDLWSTACTIYELATGKIMFTGNSNNNMLKCFMDLKGKLPNRLIRRGKFKDQHFNYNLNFLHHKKDEITGREKLVEICKIDPVRDLSLELKKAHQDLNLGQDKKITQLKDLLDKMTMVDSQQRLTIGDCLKHPFVLEEI